MDYNFNLSMIFFLLSCFLFSYFYKHILLTLISLEFMMLSSVYNIYLSLNIINMNIYFISLLLTMMICESILGLTLLIYLVRSNGNDYFKSLNLMKW